MRMPKTAIAIAALCVALSLPVLAGAAPYIPPGNSAATQYTETFPSSGGNVEVNGSIAGGGGSPQKALGKKTAEALNEAGPEGEQVAELAAEAAPEETVASDESGAGKQGDGKGESSGDQGKKKDDKGENAGGVGGNGGGPGDGATSPGQSGIDSSVSGDSAAGQVASYATLSSSGSMGIFLPLVLLAALAWAVFYVWRRRRGEDSPAAGA